MPHPRYTQTRIDAPHVTRFCADLGAQLLLARRRQRLPNPALPRLLPSDALSRLRQDLLNVENARQLYAERMERIVERILRPEIALAGEPESTVDLWRVTLAIWQRRSEQCHAEAREIVPHNDRHLTASALADCWDALIEQTLTGLEAAAALCSGQEAVRPAYEAALTTGTAAPPTQRHITPPPEPIRQLVNALHQHNQAKLLGEYGALVQSLEDQHRTLDRHLRQQADRTADTLGWLALLALMGLA